jgi:hypothetical protein
LPKVIEKPGALRGIRSILLTAAPILLLTSVCAASPIYYLATDQTGAQTQIDTAHTSSWVFTPSTDFNFAGGLFQMKAGGSAIADLGFVLYQGADTTGTVLASVTLTETTFCAQVSNCGTFGFHQFFFSAAVPVLTGTQYFAQLTSGAVNTQSQAYFIKSDSSFVSDQNGTPITPSPIGALAVTAPEPSNMVLISLGLLGLSVKQFGKRRKRS